MAGGMAKAFIHSPLTPLILVAMLALGLMGLQMTPRQEDPQISVPLVDVFVGVPGASAQEVATQAVEPLERIMSEIPGVKHVYSAALREKGLITVRFKVGEQQGPSLVKVHDRLQANLDLLPRGIPAPLVKAKSIDDVPVVTLTLWSKDVDDASLRNRSPPPLQILTENQ
jgi:multidrug efflux pump subunit AcrB